MKTTLKDFAPGSRVLIDHGAGIETDVCLILRDPCGTLDRSEKGNNLVPVVRISDGMFWLKFPDRPSIAAA